MVLPPGHWRDVISGAEHPGGAQPVGEVLRHGPVAILEVADRPADQEES
ncbi:hypothetical protein [Sanguibacter sp. Z1732]